MSQRMHEEGIPMQLKNPHDLERREVRIDRAEHPLGGLGLCSFCFGPASVGVKAHVESGDPRFVFWCCDCATRIGEAAR